MGFRAPKYEFFQNASGEGYKRKAGVNAHRNAARTERVVEIPAPP